MSATLKERYAAIHREMIEQFERTAAAENHWLMYMLLGVEMMAACAISHYFVEVLELQEGYRWAYVVLWIGQILLAIGTVKLVTWFGRPTEESPLEPMNKRLWLMFIFLSINIAVLNVLTGLPVFVFLPTLAALSSMAFTALASFVSRRFGLAGLWMFLVGIVTARYPDYGFLIYGAGWFLLLQVLGIVFLLKRRRWLADLDARSAAEAEAESVVAEAIPR
ncbi:MAG: hypothetical protein NZM31_05200 [Gemmatales bacterium]|nr:hypothetical protein [Gemmatales bacterium]MDW8386394.1 hypothetical protein [Gemmatales bacterium]